MEGGKCNLVARQTLDETTFEAAVHASVQRHAILRFK